MSVVKKVDGRFVYYTTLPGNSLNSVLTSPSCGTYFPTLCIRTPAGVQSLAVLLMELQPGADGPQILAADALYQLGRVEEAYRLLLSVGPTSPRAPILARLTLLQLHRGFLYDTNQVRRGGSGQNPIVMSRVTVSFLKIE